MLSRLRIEYPQTVSGARFEPRNCSTKHKEDFIWPSLDQVRSRLTDKEIIRLDLTYVLLKDGSVLVTKSSRIVIPEGDNFRVRLCVIAHVGIAGH